MNQSIRQVQQAHRKQARGEKAMSTGRQGFAPLIIIVIATLVIGAGIGGFLVFPEKKVPPSENKKTTQQEMSLQKTEEARPPETHITKNVPIMQPPKPKSQPELKPKPTLQRTYNYFDDASHLPSCGDKKEFFTTLPLALDSFTAIDPLGLLSPTAHVFPAPHLYFRMNKKIPLYAPSNATIIGIDLIRATNRPEFADDAAILFAPCSEFKAYFDHVVDLSPKLQKVFDEATADRCDEYTLTYKNGPVNWKKCNKKVNILVSEGELIGYA